MILLIDSAGNYVAGWLLNLPKMFVTNSGNYKKGRFTWKFITLLWHLLKDGMVIVIGTG